MDKPKKLILYYSKWRCGLHGENQVGEGNTLLQNANGFQCCIGQWSIQSGATEDEIIGFDEPSQIRTHIPLFCDRNNDFKSNNELAMDCIDINDDIFSTPDEKIKRLRARLHEEGIELEVINKP